MLKQFILIIIASVLTYNLGDIIQWDKDYNITNPLISSIAVLVDAMLIAYIVVPLWYKLLDI